RATAPASLGIKRFNPGVHINVPSIHLPGHRLADHDGLVRAVDDEIHLQLPEVVLPGIPLPLSESGYRWAPAVAADLEGVAFGVDAPIKPPAGRDAPSDEGDGGLRSAGAGANHNVAVSGVY
ncbi:MAG: hypothetical protein VX437_04790, partial [Actinomycetota bacterium]|nr:hypothetical protein [Actinomycetota bacterium]